MAQGLRSRDAGRAIGPRRSEEAAGARVVLHAVDGDVGAAATLSALLKSVRERL
ncbi:MAG: hypothetical protein ACJ72W_20475 [Actinoallomurus sp.]